MSLHAKLGESDDGGRRRAARAHDDRLARPPRPNAPVTPSMSVLSARQPAAVRTSVLADPTSSARAVRSSANRSAANLPGIVTDTPTHSGPKPPTRPAIRSAVHSMRSYVQPSRPSAR